MTNDPCGPRRTRRRPTSLSHLVGTVDVSPEGDEGPGGEGAMAQDEGAARRELTSEDQGEFMARLQRNDERLAALELKIDQMAGLVERALRRRMEDKQIRQPLD